MRKPGRFILFLILLTASIAFAQNEDLAFLTPSKATMLISDSRSFCGIGTSGRRMRALTWSVSPVWAASIETVDDYVQVSAKESGVFRLSATNSSGKSAEATINVVPGSTLPAGTAMWSVDPLPGDKPQQIVQAVPSANGPDLYVIESAPGGSVVRAMTADGMQIWQTAHPGQKDAEIKELIASPQPLGTQNVCDHLHLQVAREQVAAVLKSSGIAPPNDWQHSSHWAVEEAAGQCILDFNAETNRLEHKKKVLTN